MQAEFFNVATNNHSSLALINCKQLKVSLHIYIYIKYISINIYIYIICVCVCICVDGVNCSDEVVVQLQKNVETNSKYIYFH